MAEMSLCDCCGDHRCSVGSRKRGLASIRPGNVAGPKDVWYSTQLGDGTWCEEVVKGALFGKLLQEAGRCWDLLYLA